MKFFKDELKKIRAFVFDVDGVLSHQSQNLTPDGELIRTSCTKDGYAIMYPQAVKDLCKQGDFSYKAFLNWADRQGVILTDGKNQTKLKKFGKKPVRCVFLQLNEFQDRDGFEPVMDVDQEELPFK